jgi:hypothetical protein
MSLAHIDPDLLAWIDATHPPFRRLIDPEHPDRAEDIPAFIAFLERKRAGMPSRERTPEQAKAARRAGKQRVALGFNQHALPKH